MNVTTIILIVLGVAILWGILNFFLRLTVKIFTCGCLGIVVLGIAALIARALGWI